MKSSIDYGSEYDKAGSDTARKPTSTASPAPTPAPVQTKTPGSYGGEYETAAPAAPSGGRSSTLTNDPNYSDPVTEPAREYLIPPLPKLGFPGVESPFTGPTINEQLNQQRARRQEREKQLGRPLTPSERLEVNPLEENPVFMAFGTHQIGERLPAGLIRGQGLFPGEDLQSWINRTFKRAVKPTVAGKPTDPRVQQYMGKANDAISAIIANKNNLILTDHLGNTVKGQLPQSLAQFSDAIAQTKGWIFKQYDALKQQTEQAGARILTLPVVNELQKITNSRIIQTHYPELVRYASDLAYRYSNQFSFSMSEAQDLVQHLNQTLKPFYTNPTYETTGRASVDAMVANKMREMLDLVITQTTGEAYQPLKNMHGALQAIEKEVTNRAMVVGRQELGGGILGRLGDIVSAEHVISGLAHLNPDTFATGVAVKGWAQFMKWLRNPDRAVANIFEAKEQGPGTMAAPPRPVIPSIPASPLWGGVGGDDNDPGYEAITGYDAITRFLGP